MENPQHMSRMVAEGSPQARKARCSHWGGRTASSFYTCIFSTKKSACILKCSAFLLLNKCIIEIITTCLLDTMHLWASLVVSLGLCQGLMEPSGLLRFLLEGFLSFPHRLRNSSKCPCVEGEEGGAPSSPKGQSAPTFPSWRPSPRSHCGDNHSHRKRKMLASALVQNWFLTQCQQSLVHHARGHADSAARV